MAKGAYLSSDDKSNIRGSLETWYYQDKKAPAKELLRRVNKTLENREISLSYIQKEMADIHKKDKNGELQFDVDKAWSLGVTKGENLAPDLLKTLASIQREMAKVGRFLTIRRAQWIAKLHPILKVPDELTLLQIASFYCRRDQLADKTRKAYADTRVLDDTFIIKQDVSFEAILRQWIDTFLYTGGPVTESDAAEAKRNTERILDDLTPKQDSLLKQFVSLLALAARDYDEREKVIAFAKEHPAITPLALRWLAFSVRRDIVTIFGLEVKTKGDKAK